MAARRQCDAPAGLQPVTRQNHNVPKMMRRAGTARQSGAQLARRPFPMKDCIRLHTTHEPMHRGPTLISAIVSLVVITPASTEQTHRDKRHGSRCKCPAVVITPATGTTTESISTPLTVRTNAKHVIRVFGNAS